MASKERPGFDQNNYGTYCYECGQVHEAGKEELCGGNPDPWDLCVHPEGHDNDDEYRRTKNRRRP
jgi:hypothetical protein